MFSINEKEIDKCKSYVNKALRLFEGDSIPGRNLFEFEIVSYILQDMIKSKAQFDYFMFRGLIKTVLFFIPKKDVFFSSRDPPKLP